MNAMVEPHSEDLRVVNLWSARLLLLARRICAGNHPHAANLDALNDLL